LRAGADFDHCEEILHMVIHALPVIYRVIRCMGTPPVGNGCYLPMQNELKIAPSKSSLV
jgi:hypothetical protein